jgi:putative transposase
MTEYRRASVPGGSWFFTVNLPECKTNRLLVEKTDLLRSAFEYNKQRYPFRMDAVVILPDHLHCIWTLPQADADFSTRWNMLKGYFSHHIHSKRRKNFYQPEISPGKGNMATSILEASFT